MKSVAGLVRRQLPGVIALVLITALFLVARLPVATAGERADIAGKYRFTEFSVALPGGYPQRHIRDVNKTYEHVRAWISSVGAGIAMNDLDGDGLSNDLCVSDTRIDQVVVSPTPGAGTPRYEPFALNPGPLPMDHMMAPMGCVPGDYNEDGRVDILVYYWGRTPIVFLGRTAADATTAGTPLTAASYRAAELVPQASGTGYTGPRWNSNAATVADFDGDGHDDIFIGNYFPDSLVLGSENEGGVSLNHSMSRAFNGGEDHIFRWTGAAADSVSLAPAPNAMERDVSKGWALAAGANDLDGDLMPELYVGNDFGPDHLLHNVSTPGNIRFEPVVGPEKAWVPNSKRVGADSFKGMGVDFGDLNHDGLYDMYVSNITTTFGLEESHFCFISTAKSADDLRAHFDRGVAPYRDDSASLGVAWSGWGWDVKMADFANSGDLSILQATGFVKGEVNRWAQLQELAASNDVLLSNPRWWPNVRDGDDIGGFQHLQFFSRNKPGERFVDISQDLGLAIPVPTRGIAVGDADGDGGLDVAVARQWDAPVFYHNESPDRGAYLGLKLTHPAAAQPTTAQPTTAQPTTATPTAGSGGSPVIGAQVRATTPDGRVFVGRVDGGSGHSGRRSHEVVLGLGDVTGPVDVQIRWRDRAGQLREQSLQLTPGWHALQLGTQAMEATS